MIQNVSYLHDGSSINANIEQVQISVKYSSIREAIDLLARVSDVVYMCKTDIKDAFTMLPITIRDQPKLGFKFRDKLYLDKTLATDGLCYELQIV